MDELMKTLEGAHEEKPDEEPAEVNGLLAIHITSIQMLEEDIEPSMIELLQLRVICGSHTKFFPLSRSEETNRVMCGRTRHFPIKLPKECGSPDNLLTVELFTKSPLLLDHVSVLGRASLHLHDIIHDSPLVGECSLKEDRGEVFAIVSGEFAFTYGMFGFGESSQLHQAVLKPSHYLSHSMFPRLTPPEGRGNNSCVLMPRPTAHPSFIPFNQKVSLSLQESPSVSSHPVPQLLVARMTRLSSLHAELQHKKDRQQRLQFLQDTVLNTQAHSSQLGIRVTSRTPRPHGN